MTIKAEIRTTGPKEERGVKYMELTSFEEARRISEGDKRNKELNQIAIEQPILDAEPDLMEVVEALLEETNPPVNSKLADVKKRLSDAKAAKERIQNI